MKRRLFLGALLAPVALLFRRKEEKPPEWVREYASVTSPARKIIELDINQIHKNPLSYEECYFEYNGHRYFYTEGMAETEERFEMEQAQGLFRIRPPYHISG